MSEDLNNRALTTIFGSAVLSTQLVEARDIRVTSQRLRRTVVSLTRRVHGESRDIKVGLRDIPAVKDGASCRHVHRDRDIDADLCYSRRNKCYDYKKPQESHATINQVFEWRIAEDKPRLISMQVVALNLDAVASSKRLKGADNVPQVKKSGGRGTLMIRVRNGIRPFCAS